MDEVAPEQELWQLTDEELAEALLVTEVRMRCGYAEMLTLVTEAHSRGLARNLGYGTCTTTLLAEMLRVGPAEARARLRHAETTQPRPAVSGGQVPAADAGNRPSPRRRRHRGRACGRTVPGAEQGLRPRRCRGLCPG